LLLTGRWGGSQAYKTGNFVLCEEKGGFTAVAGKRGISNLRERIERRRGAEAAGGERHNYPDASPD